MLERTASGLEQGLTKTTNLSLITTREEAVIVIDRSHSEILSSQQVEKKIAIQ